MIHNLNEQSSVNMLAHDKSFDVQPNIASAKKFNSVKPLENKLNKYIKDLETMNVSKLSQMMSNKKYFHKFYLLQDIERVTLLNKDGKLNDKAFELINNNK